MEDLKGYLTKLFESHSTLDSPTMGGIFLFKEKLSEEDTAEVVSCLEILDDSYSDALECNHPFTFSPTDTFSYYYQLYVGNSTDFCKAIQEDPAFCKLVAEGEVLYDSVKLARLLVELAQEYHKMHQLIKHYAELSPVPGRMVGDKIKFVEEKRPYTIRARNERYLVCTKPFNLKKTVFYTVVDLYEGIRGTENLVFGMGAETDWQCWEMLTRLVEGTSEISRKNFIDLKIV